MWDPYAEFSSFQLPNGLTVFHREIDRPWIICHAIIHAGANQDPPGKEGVAHFFEHIMGDNIPGISREDLQEIIRNSGGLVEWGVTGLMFTSYLFKIPLSVAPRILDAFGSMLFAATIEHAIERERNVITQEFNAYFPCIEKYNTLQDFLRRLYLCEERRGRSLTPLGTPSTIAQITAFDLQSFYGQYYTPSNTSLVITGGLATSELEKLLLSSSLSRQKVGHRITPKAAREPHTIITSTERATLRPLSDFVSTKSDRGEYSTLALFPGSAPMNHMRMLRSILQEILHEAIRKERQWTYGASVSLNYLQDVVECEISIPLVAEGFKSITDVIKKIIDNLPAEYARFEKLKKQRLANIAMIDINNGTIVEAAANDVRDFHQIETLQDMTASYESVDFQDIVALASYLSHERRWTLMLHP